MTATAPIALRYRGMNSSYVDIATRGTDEFLGLAVEYAVHPSNVGCFIIRFIAHGTGVTPKTKFTHLTYREPAKFLVMGEGVTNEVFKGVRLNKLAIPVFKPAVKDFEVDKFALKFGVWTKLEEWITEQVQAEGFTLTVDLQKEIRNSMVKPMTIVEEVTSVIEFPNLASPENKAAALKLVQKPVVDEDDEDADEDGKDEDGGWLN